ncbi:hypothetical protein DEO72_LG11g1608 [Vigna unguiculata]|uniref:Uncharacterized protein n=1 Tax=Vigna unguiculata TaxID=3917 RepID=A0A4D6NQP9_VIGUN|nr:hypothetical protein DEO72_LG11g1608 [Vigna unguiculata]
MVVRCGGDRTRKKKMRAVRAGGVLLARGGFRLGAVASSGWLRVGGGARRKWWRRGEACAICGGGENGGAAVAARMEDDGGGARSGWTREEDGVAIRGGRRGDGGGGGHGGWTERRKLGLGLWEMKMRTGQPSIGQLVSARIVATWRALVG